MTTGNVGSDPRRDAGRGHQLVPEFGTLAEATADERRQAARVVAAHATDLHDARELLDMLGLLDVSRREATAGSAIAPDRSAPSGSSGLVVKTAAAAEALRTTTATLHRLVKERVVTPARTDADGTRWWHLPDLRLQVAGYLADHEHENPPPADTERPGTTKEAQLMTSAAADPTDGPRPLVTSSAAAEALRTSTGQLHGWADAGIITATRVDPDGSRWWNLHHLRRELATYLNQHRDDDLPR